MLVVRKDGYIFKSTPINSKKKYKVYRYDKDKQKDVYITSFGQKGASQFFDSIGYYAHLNNYDENMRRAYRARHKNDYINDDTKAGFYSWHYLW
jgi:PKD repeat protein